MSVSVAFLFFFVMLLVAAVLEPVLEKHNIPSSVVLVLIGYTGSEFVTRILHLDIGIHWENFQGLITHILLPVLIFHAAMMTDMDSLKANWLPIFMLALPLLLVATVIMAMILFFGIDYPSHFPWIAALLTGAILSATDPVAVIFLLKKYGAPKRLVTLLEAEGAFGDVAAIMLFGMIIAISLKGGFGETHWMAIAFRFLSVLLGGVATGAGVGIIACVIAGLCRSGKVYILVTIIGAYSAFIIANDYLGVSGAMAVLTAALIINIPSRRLMTTHAHSFADEYWEFTVSVAGNLIFLMAGVTITFSMFTERWAAMLIGVASYLCARTTIILGVFPVLNLLPAMTPLPFRQQIFLMWGGVHGTVTLALALSLPFSLDYWYTVQSIIYGVVLFTLFVQTTTMLPLLKKLKTE